MANPDFASGGISTKDIREDGDHYYTTYRFVHPANFAAGTPGAATWLLGKIRINGTGTVERVRAMVGRLVNSAAAVGSLDFDVQRAAQGTAINAAATILTGVMAFCSDAGAGATDPRRLSNTWFDGTPTAAGTRVYDGDLLAVVITLGGGGAPTQGECPEVEVVVRSDF